MHLEQNRNPVVYIPARSFSARVRARHESADGKSSLSASLRQLRSDLRFLLSAKCNLTLEKLHRLLRRISPSSSRLIDSLSVRISRFYICHHKFEHLSIHVQFLSYFSSSFEIRSRHDETASMRFLFSQSTQRRLLAKTKEITRGDIVF